MMRREDMKRLLDCPLVRAWAEGRKLQHRDGRYWNDVVDDRMTYAWIIENLDRLRIKPEPKIVPWTIHDAAHHVDKTFVNCDEFHFDIHSIDNEGVYYYDKHINPWFVTYHDLAKECRLMDGSPCGKVVDGAE